MRVLGEVLGGYDGVEDVVAGGYVSVNDEVELVRCPPVTVLHTFFKVYPYEDKFLSF